MRAVLLSCLFAAAASAQVVVVDHPNLASPTNIDRPFGGGLGRYQQWYNPTPVLTGAIAEPMRPATTTAVRSGASSRVIE